MDPARVALFGSVSKTLSPALGLGWVAVPPQWTPMMQAPPVLDQLALADFDDYREAPGEPALVLGYGNLAGNAVGDAARLLREAAG
jgi:hypothetical protein